MQRSMLLVDYYGMCDNSGTAMGHSVKVAPEYAEILEQDYTVDLMASPCIVRGVSRSGFAQCFELQHDIKAFDLMNLYKRIKDKLKIFANLGIVYHNIQRYDVVWFYVTDFFGFLYILFRKKPVKTKILCSICHQGYTGNRMDTVLNKVVQEALKKVDLIVYTQKEMKFDTFLKTFYMPDYYFDSFYYNKYKVEVKKEKVVCLGTMNSYKKLEELVEIFNKLEIQLEIIGKFSEPERAEHLKKVAAGHINIEDRILPVEEYYEKLAESKYSVLPYDTQQYSNRTSGVLLESIFLNTIPVAPTKLLEQNQLPGIGFDAMKDLEKRLTEPVDNQIYLTMESLRSGEFSKKKIAQGLIGKIMELK